MGVGQGAGRGGVVPTAVISNCMALPVTEANDWADGGNNDLW